MYGSIKVPILSAITVWRTGGRSTRRVLITHSNSDMANRPVDSSPSGPFVCDESWKMIETAGAGGRLRFNWLLPNVCTPAPLCGKQIAPKAASPHVSPAAACPGQTGAKRGAHGVLAMCTSTQPAMVAGNFGHIAAPDCDNCIC
jgi:hypothetical protein